MEKDLYPIMDYKDFADLKGRILFEEPEVNYVLTEYLTHAESLYQYRDCIPFLWPRESVLGTKGEKI